MPEPCGAPGGAGGTSEQYPDDPEPEPEPTEPAGEGEGDRGEAERADTADTDSAHAGCKAKMNI